MSILDLISANQRLKILELLAAQADYAAPDYMIKQALNTIERVKTSSDKLATELAWLEEQGLIIKMENPHLGDYQLTNRGLDVATKTITHPGVARPLPE